MKNDRKLKVLATMFAMVALTSPVLAAPPPTGPAPAQPKSSADSTHPTEVSPESQEQKLRQLKP